MQIDRARFLLLTASLAGGGCSASPATSGASAPPEPSAQGTELVVPEVPDPADSATTTTTSAPATIASTGPGQVPPQTPPGACDNDVGTVPACSIAAPPGPFCESFADTKASCKSYKTALRNAVAAKAVACLNATSGTQDACDYTKSESCATEAIRTACVQPSTFSACSPVVSQCAGYSWGKLAMADCQALLSAVKDGKRKSMITCMTEGCSIESCTWMLR